MLRWLQQEGVCALLGTPLSMQASRMPRACGKSVRQPKARWRRMQCMRARSEGSESATAEDSDMCMSWVHSLGWHEARRAVRVARTNKCRVFGLLPCMPRSMALRMWRGRIAAILDETQGRALLNARRERRELEDSSRTNPRTRSRRCNGTRYGGKRDGRERLRKSRGTQDRTRNTMRHVLRF